MMLDLHYNAAIFGDKISISKIPHTYNEHISPKCMSNIYLYSHKLKKTSQIYFFKM